MAIKYGKNRGNRRTFTRGNANSGSWRETMNELFGEALNMARTREDTVRIMRMWAEVFGTPAEQARFKKEQEEQNEGPIIVTATSVAVVDPETAIPLPEKL